MPSRVKRTTAKNPADDEIGSLKKGVFFKSVKGIVRTRGVKATARANEWGKSTLIAADQ